MFRQTYKEDLQFFEGVAKVKAEKLEDIPTEVLMPAFVTSEIKRAFQIGFLIYIPFIVIDMIVAKRIDVHGYDDAAANGNIPPVQDTAVRAGETGGYSRYRRWSPGSGNAGIGLTHPGSKGEQVPCNRAK